VDGVVPPPDRALGVRCIRSPARKDPLSDATLAALAWRIAALRIVRGLRLYREFNDVAKRRPGIRITI
jgi:hypothetical protein